MKNVANALLIFLVLNLSHYTCLAASIKIVDNKYFDYGRFLEEYARSHSLILPKALQKKISQKEGGFSLISALNVVDLPFDEYKGCDQLGYELTWNKAIEIKGAIEPQDNEAFEKALHESKSLDDTGCGLTVLIDSPGGDVNEAFKIGRLVSAEQRFVIVPEGGQCLSACIFILFAARYEDASRHISKAIAFSDSTIAIHWPDLPERGRIDLQRLALADPNKLYEQFGKSWTTINGYSVEATASSWLSIALLHSLSLEGQMYVLNSAIERKIAGVSTIVLPSSSDQLNTSDQSLRNICLVRLVKPASVHVADSFSFEMSKRDIYSIYYPAEDSICIAETSTSSVRVIAGSYPVVNGSDSTAPREFDVWPSVPTVRKDLWKALSSVGLNREALGTKSGIGKSIDELTKADLQTEWGLFARLAEDYGCVMCGNSRGTVVFSRCDPPSKEDVRDRYAISLRKAGFACDRELIVYLYTKMRFLYESSRGLAETIETIPGVLSEGSVNISKEKCQNVFQVCSTETGSVSGSGAFTIQRSAPN